MTTKKELMKRTRATQVFVDIDGTICDQLDRPDFDDSDKDYANRKPYSKRIKEVKEQENQETSKADTLKEKFKKRAIETVGGSMVFIEKDLMFWDGESKDESDKS